MIDHEGRLHEHSHALVMEEYDVGSVCSKKLGSRNARSKVGSMSWLPYRRPLKMRRIAAHFR